MTLAATKLYESLARNGRGPAHLVPLQEVLCERQETPDEEAIATGQVPIVAKIGFHSGKIELRTETNTKTKMILIRPGDLVVSGINAAKGAIAIYPQDAAGPAAATIHYGSYEVNEHRADRAYLWWLLRSNLFGDILAHYVPGGIKTELKAKRLLPVPIPLPPLKEQRRIVTKIEQLSAMIMGARDLRRLSSAATAAFLGSHLNIVSESFGKLGALEDVLTGKPRNGWSARCDNTENGVPVLTLTAVTGFCYDGSAYKRTSLPTDPAAHYWLSAGDLLITRSNTPDLVGHAAVYDGQPAPCIYPDLMMRVPLRTSRASVRFAWWWMQTPAVREFIKNNAKGTSPTMKKISQVTVMRIPFPTESTLDEQHRIVAYLDGIQAKVDRLKVLQEKTAVELDAILPTILDKAFKGELVAPETIRPHVA